MDLLLCFAVLTEKCSTFKSQVCTELGSPFHSNKDLFSAACRCVTVQYMIAALMFTSSGKDHSIRQGELKEHSHSDNQSCLQGPAMWELLCKSSQTCSIYLISPDKIPALPAFYDTFTGSVTAEPGACRQCLTCCIFLISPLCALTEAGFCENVKYLIITGSQPCLGWEGP